MSEYDNVLNLARTKAEAFRSTAKEFIPNMYAALLKENQNISPIDARDRIQKDCVGIWSRRQSWMHYLMKQRIKKSKKW